ncbi:MAG: hypothetical protein JW983_06820 [Elusimicrobia bacterium]|nr:hypothetical protein [Elusimicrobiota bacterium]
MKTIIKYMAVAVCFLIPAVLFADDSTPPEYNFMVEYGTVTLSGGTILDVDGSVYISTEGSIIAESGGADIRLTKRWTSTGTFTPGDSTVEFYDITVSTLYGNTTFYNLKCEVAGSTIVFTAGSTQTITSGGALTLTGTSGSEICLRSSLDGVGWYIDNIGDLESVSYVNLKDGNASGNNISAEFGTSIDSGGNDILEPPPHWILYQILSVNIDPEGKIPGGTYDFGEVDLAGSSQTINTIEVRNDGNTVENFAIKCETNTANSPWYPNTAVGNDMFVLRAGFHTASQPLITAFGAEDVVSSGTYQTCQTQGGGGRYTIDGSEDGESVPENDTIDLWLRLDMPTTTSTIEDQKIILYIRAEEP